MLYLSRLYKLDYLICVGKHSVSGKACDDCASAVHACHVLVLVIASALYRLFDNGGEVLVIADVAQLGI